jgi:glycosyltransferase involved in cell wall biosynthesis
MTKLVIQIPSYNEAQKLPATLGSRPTTLPAVDEVEWLLIDDDSADETAGFAHGVNHIVVLRGHQDLPAAFLAGLDASLSLDGDTIVNNRRRQSELFGSWVMRKISNTQVQDAPGGFRAMRREAARRLHVFNDYTYVWLRTPQKMPQLPERFLEFRGELP